MTAFFAGSPLSLQRERVVGDRLELFTNQHFNVDATGWTLAGSWAVAAGVASRPATAAAEIISQPIVPVEGISYRLQANVPVCSVSTARWRFSNGTAVQGNNRTVPGIYSEIMVAAAGNNNVAYLANTGTDVSIDDVSMMRTIAMPRGPRW